MNNFNTLFSLIRGRSNQRFFNMFGNKKTNNGSMILWSLLGLTTLGVIGSRNTRWVQKIREGYNNLRNNTRIPLKNQVYFFANEFTEDITPKIHNKNNNNE